MEIRLRTRIRSRIPIRIRVSNRKPFFPSPFFILGIYNWQSQSLGIIIVFPGIFSKAIQEIVTLPFILSMFSFVTLQ